jgi:hypothetical protein
MNTTTKPESKQKNAAPVGLLIIAGVIVLIGIIVLIVGRANQSDPTLTKAPPAAPGAVTLQGAPQKLAHGPLYTMNGSTPTINTKGALAPPAPTNHQ